MYLMFVISFLCFLMAFASKITKMVVKLLLAESRETSALRREAETIRAELSQIMMRDDYINYVKVERKLVALEGQLNETKSRDGAKQLMYEYGGQYGSMAALALSLLFISFYYRHTPVIVFGSEFNFAPFERVVSFPTTVPNAVSVVFWILVNKLVARTIAERVK